MTEKSYPNPLFLIFLKKKIRVCEENGNVILSPVKEKPNADELFGMYNDGKLSSNSFIRQKAVEKEMEN